MSKKRLQLRHYNDVITELQEDDEAVFKNVSRLSELFEGIYS